MQIPVVGADQLFTFLKPYGRDLSLRVGDIIKAEVLNVLESGNVSLRLTGSDGQSGILIAKANVALVRGDVVRLKVTGADNEIKLQYLGLTSDSSTRTRIEPDSMTSRILQTLTELAGAKLKQEDMNAMTSLFRSLPHQVKSQFPEFARLELLMPAIGKLNADVLKNSVEGSGVLFETRLKLAAEELAQKGRSPILERMLGPEPDQKALLLRMKEMLTDERVLGSLRSAGVKADEVSAAIDRLLRNVEFFQLSSRVNDILYTFLPVGWQDMKDGEIAFRKEPDEDGVERFGCDITLDIQPLGRMKISVSLFRSEFYVSFSAEQGHTSALLAGAAQTLEEKFGAAGLALRAVNVMQKKGIKTEPGQKQGLNLKV